MDDRIFSLRMTKALADKIRMLSEFSRLDASEIVRRTARWMARNGAFGEQGTKGDGNPPPELDVVMRVRNFPAMQMPDAETFRQVLEMRVDEALEKSRGYAPFTTALREGRDYVIVGQEA